MRAETRVNAEQAPKRVIAEADPPQVRGRPPTGREESDTSTGRFPPGYWRRHAWKMGGVATREALSVPCTRQPGPREGQAWAGRVADGPAVLRTRGNARRGKGP